MMTSMENITCPVIRDADPVFPYARSDWSPANAELLAQDLGLKLTVAHWEMINGLQEYFSKHETGHIDARELHDALDERFHEFGGLKRLYQLFPGGPIAQGCRLAGLDVPSGATNNSFGSVQ